MSAFGKKTAIPAEEAGRFLDVTRDLSQIPHLPKRKKQIYSLWIVGYLRFLEQTESGDPSPQNLRSFLERIDEREGVDESVHQQAAEALVFFHECVLSQQVGETNGRLHMMSASERDSILNILKGPEKLLARLVFQTELDLTEALRLRVGDVDLKNRTLVVSDARGCSERFVNVTADLAEDLRHHLKRVRSTHEKDLEANGGWADIPKVVEEQFHDAGRMWVWQFVFPAAQPTLDLRSGAPRRYPMQPTRLINALEQFTAPMTRMTHTAPEDASGIPETVFVNRDALELEDMVLEAAALTKEADTEGASAKDVSDVTDRAASHLNAWKPTYT